MTKNPKKEPMAENIREAFAFGQQVIDDWDNYPDEFIAIPATSPLVGQIFTKERQRLLAKLKEHGPFGSVDALAGSVHRDATRVSRDLKPLVKAGMVLLRAEGKTKQVSATNRPLILQ